MPFLVRLATTERTVKPDESKKYRKLYPAAIEHVGAAVSGNAYAIQIKLTPRIRLPFGNANPRWWNRRT